MLVASSQAESPGRLRPWLWNPRAHWLAAALIAAVAVARLAYLWRTAQRPLWATAARVADTTHWAAYQWLDGSNVLVWLIPDPSTDYVKKRWGNHYVLVRRAELTLGRYDVSTRTWTRLPRLAATVHADAVAASGWMRFRVSPNGRRLLWLNREGDYTICDASGARPVRLRLPAPTCAAIWLGDSRHVVCLATARRTNAVTSVFVVSPGHPARKLDLRWARDAQTAERASPAAAPLDGPGQVACSGSTVTFLPTTALTPARLRPNAARIVELRVGQDECRVRTWLAPPPRAARNPELELSPDGRYGLWRTVDAGPRGRQSFWLSCVDGSDARPLGYLIDPDGGVEWLPAGNALSFTHNHALWRLRVP